MLGHATLGARADAHTCRTGCSRITHSNRRAASLVRAGSNHSPQQQECSSSSQEAGLARRGVLQLLAVAAASPAAEAFAAAQPAFDLSQIAEPSGIFQVVTSDRVSSLTPTERQIFQLNKRIQQQNRVPADFPVFVREGFNVTAIADDFLLTKDGLAYKDFREGTGGVPEEGQEVVFNYTGYNESGGVIDTSYRQGRPAQTRLGINGLIPGFELGIRSMRVGGFRRVIVPPELGPPVGPSTFFSAKQCEVFDIELVAIRSCRRRQVMMFSDVVCE